MSDTKSQSKPLPSIGTPTTLPETEPIRDSLSGLTRQQEFAWDELINGPEYDSDPLRRYVRSHGGRCSGGGGPC